MMKKFFQDLLKAFGIGAGTAAVLFTLLFLCGLLFGANGYRSGLEAAKNGLLLIGSLGMFLVAGMILSRGRNSRKFADKEGWQRHFSVLGPETVILFFSIAFIVLASAADWLLMI